MKKDKGSLIPLLLANTPPLHNYRKNHDPRNSDKEHRTVSILVTFEFIVNSGAVFLLEYSRNFSLWCAWR
jgi:hypothetical protein